MLPFFQNFILFQCLQSAFCNPTLFAVFQASYEPRPCEFSTWRPVPGRSMNWQKVNSSCWGRSGMIVIILPGQWHPAWPPGQAAAGDKTGHAQWRHVQDHRDGCTGSSLTESMADLGASWQPEHCQLVCHMAGSGQVQIDWLPPTTEHQLRVSRLEGNTGRPALTHLVGTDKLIRPVRQINFFLTVAMKSFQRFYGGWESQSIQSTVDRQQISPQNAGCDINGCAVVRDK